MRRKPERIVPVEMERRHRRHLQRFVKPVPGNYPNADGHALTMVVVTTFQCECGCKLTKRSKRR
jgi:hypothetical protein